MWIGVARGKVSSIIITDIGTAFYANPVIVSLNHTRSGHIHETLNSVHAYMHM